MADAEAAKAAGNEAWTRGDISEAIAQYTKAIDLTQGARGGGGGAEGNLPLYYSNRSACYLREGDGAKALLDADKCIGFDETWPKGWGRKGKALLLLRRYLEAADAYKRGMELDATNVDMRQGFLDAQRLATGTGTASSRATAGAGSIFGSLQRYLRANAVLTVLTGMRYMLVACAVSFAIPGLGGVTAYRRAMLLHLAITVGMLYKNHGWIRRDIQYLQGVATDPLIQQLAVGFIFYMQRPYVLGLLMVVIPALVQVLWYTSCLLQYCQFSSALKAMDRLVAPVAPALVGIPNWAAAPVTTKWPKAVEKSRSWVAQLQVAFGLLLVLELALPRRNFIMLLLYWQVLRMGVMLEGAQTMRTGDSRGGSLTQAFKQLHARILGVLSGPRCPAALLSAYTRIIPLMSKAVQLPEPGQAAPQRPCTIM